MVDSLHCSSCPPVSEGTQRVPAPSTDVAPLMAAVMYSSAGACGCGTEKMLLALGKKLLDAVRQRVNQRGPHLLWCITNVNFVLFSCLVGTVRYSCCESGEEKSSHKREISNSRAEQLLTWRVLWQEVCTPPYGSLNISVLLPLGKTKKLPLCFCWAQSAFPRAIILLYKEGK